MRYAMLASSMVMVYGQTKKEKETYKLFADQLSVFGDKYTWTPHTA